MDEGFPKGAGGAVPDQYADLLRQWEEEHGQLRDEERARLVEIWRGAEQDRSIEERVAEELKRIAQERK